uniref:Unconventional myosin-XVIIIa n=1 Tax=Cacopsylla melanoneura TaxID=428564 RepID=A0A8D9EGA8_9HEMI
MPTPSSVLLNSSYYGHKLPSTPKPVSVKSPRLGGRSRSNSPTSSSSSSYSTYGSASRKPPQIEISTPSFVGLGSDRIKRYSKVDRDADEDVALDQKINAYLSRPPAAITNKFKAASVGREPPIRVANAKNDYSAASSRTSAAKNGDLKTDFSQGSSTRFSSPATKGSHLDTSWESQRTTRGYSVSPTPSSVSHEPVHNVSPVHSDSTPLSRKIAEFLKRTDHITEEWQKVGTDNKTVKQSSTSKSQTKYVNETKSTSRPSSRLSNRDETIDEQTRSSSRQSFRNEKDSTATGNEVRTLSKQRIRNDGGLPSDDESASVSSEQGNRRSVSRLSRDVEPAKSGGEQTGNNAAEHLNEARRQQDSTRPKASTRQTGRLGEITEDYADEHSTATLISERLSHETTERAKLERDLAEAQAVNKKLQEAGDKLELEVQCLRSTSELISLEDGEDETSVEGGSSESNDLYRKKWERAMRELEFTKHRLNQQHQDDLEQLVGLRKQLEKKLSDAFEQIEEQRNVASEWKRKVTKVNSEMSDLRLLLEEQSSRNNLLEKKQRKFDAEYQMLQDELRQERNHKEKALRDKELALGDKYTMEQNLSSLKLELELKEQKVSHLQQELEELTFSGNTEEEVANLKKKKHSLEAKLSDQEEELDELAGQVQMLEQAKLKVEMNLEQVRKSHRKELASKDEELEALRCSTMKKVKALQCQLESEHESRTALLRERHELERRLNNLEENDVASRTVEVETNMRLKRDLKRTKALLKDTQTMLSQSRQDNANKLMVRQLRNQLEDAEHSRSASIKAKQTLESDLADISVQLEETQRSKADLEARLSAVLRERGQLQSQLDENEEEMTEVLKKYQASVQQLSTEQANLQEATTRISELETELSSYKDQLTELNSKLESIETHGDPSSTLALKRLQLKSKELESKLEFEHTTRSRLEVQINRLKENTDKLQSECNLLRGKDTSNANEVRKHQRVVRELKETVQSMEAKQINEGSKRKELEKELQCREAEITTLKSELSVASQRIADLQHAIQGDLEDESSDSENSDDNSTDHELDPSSDEDGEFNHIDLKHDTSNGYKKSKEDVGR